MFVTGVLPSSSPKAESTPVAKSWPEGASALPGAARELDHEARRHEPQEAPQEQPSGLREAVEECQAQGAL